MTKIVDPDDLNQGTEIVIDDTGANTVQLLVAGNLSTDGVTLQCVYSFLKEEWKDDADLIKFPFPLIAITEEQFELVNGWDWADTTTRELIRDGGWALKDSGGVSEEEYTNISTLGSFDAPGSDLAYYAQASGSGAPTDFVLAGPTNQAVKVYGDVTHGDFDYRDYFKIFLREEAKTYGSYNLLTEQGLSTLTYKKYALPLTNDGDVKVEHSDLVVSGSAPYTGVTVEYHSSPFQRDIGGTLYDFDILVTGNQATAEEIYEKCQWLLRRTFNIDSGSDGNYTRGDTADELMAFTGEQLITATGVFIDNYQIADQNRITFTDTGGTGHDFPYTAAGSLLFSQTLQDDPDTAYWMFLNSGSGAYGSEDAIIVEDFDGDPITGTGGVGASVDFDYDYDYNVQGGLSPGIPRPVTVVAIGLDTAQFVEVDYTLTRSITNDISIVSALERNYDNP